MRVGFFGPGWTFRPGLDVIGAKTTSVLIRVDPESGMTTISGLGGEYLMMKQAGYVYKDGKLVE